MSLKVEVISKETIKPISPTPHHLRTLKLSLIDQYTPHFPVSLILFYPAKSDNEYRSNKLKQSLSEILTHFYPLGGRINDKKSIDCNDEGVDFLVARVNCELSQVLSHPIAEELNQLIPNGNFYVLGPKPLLAIQVNIFECGGMALCVCISHKAGDASAFSKFLNDWAVIAKGGNEIVRPEFDMTSLFPPKDVSPSIPPSGTEKITSKRFVFDATNIAALRAKISNNLYVEHPTRVEAVSALIWRCAMNVAKMRTVPVKSSVYVANLAVNLRGRMVPPLSNLYFGNHIISTMATATTTTESDTDLHCLVGKLQEAKRKIDSDYVRKLLVDDGISKFYDSLNEVYELYAKGELELYTLSSWCRFPFYEADFGWGKPTWISSVNLVSRNIIMLVDTKCGNGVEALIALDEEDMARFECEPDIVAFTSQNQIV